MDDAFQRITTMRKLLPAVLFIVLASCGESPDVKAAKLKADQEASRDRAEQEYARALQVYNTELELYDRANRVYQATDREVSDFFTGQMRRERDQLAASAPPGEDLLDVFKEKASPSENEASLRAEAAEIRKRVTTDPRVKLATEERAAAARRLEHAANKLKELEAANPRQP